MSALIDRLKGSRLFRTIVGFSFVGVIVTMISLVMLYVFNEVCHMNVYIAYVLSYTLSIAISFLLNARIVFKSRFTWKKIILYYTSYICSMILGVIILGVYEWSLPDVSHTILSYMVIPITTIYNYFFTSKILTSEKKF